MQRQAPACSDDGGSVALTAMSRSLVCAAALLVCGSAMADEQQPPPSPLGTSPVVWFFEVRGGENSDQHGLWPQGGPIALGTFQWACRYGALSRSKPSQNTVSESVTLTCTRGDAVVSSDVACAYRPDVTKEGLTASPRQARLELSARGVAGKRSIYLTCLVSKAYDPN